MDEYRHRLERTQIKLCVLLTVLLFIGLLILPRIGQAIWIAIIAGIYIRVTLVIAKREELLEKHSQNNQRSAYYDSSERRIVISDSENIWAVDLDRQNDCPTNDHATHIVRASRGACTHKVESRCPSSGELARGS